MRLVLDTNVWLDWLVFGDPGVERIRAAVTGGHAQVCVDEACLAELERVLAYPLRRSVLTAGERSSRLGEARRIAHLYSRDACSEPGPLPLCRDPDDQKFLELARDCRAQVLVTKDHALLALGRRLSFAVVTPAQFAQ